MAWLFLFLEACGGSDDGSGVKGQRGGASRGEKNHILTVIWNRETVEPSRSDDARWARSVDDVRDARGREFRRDRNERETPSVARVQKSTPRHALVIDDLLEVPHGHGRAPQVVHLALLLLRALGVGLDPLLVPHELLLHEKPVLDALELELAQQTLGRGRHVGKPVRAVQTLLLQLLPHARGRRGRLPFLLLGFFLLVPLLPVGHEPALVLTHLGPSATCGARARARRPARPRNAVRNTRASDCVDARAEPSNVRSEMGFRSPRFGHLPERQL